VWSPIDINGAPGGLNDGRRLSWIKRESALQMSEKIINSCNLRKRSRAKKNILTRSGRAAHRRAALGFRAGGTGILCLNINIRIKTEKRSPDGNVLKSYTSMSRSFNKLVRRKIRNERKERNESCSAYNHAKVRFIWIRNRTT
jgi:hypothetical protein